MNSVCNILVVVYFATAGPRLLVLNCTVTNATHSGGIVACVVFQVTLTEPFTLSALAVTVLTAKSTATVPVENKHITIA